MSSSLLVHPALLLLAAAFVVPLLRGSARNCAILFSPLLAMVAVLPSVVNQSVGIDYSVTQFLGGTGLLIVVSVTMDFLQRVEANLLMRNYQGFLGGSDGEGGPRMRGPRG